MWVLDFECCAGLFCIYVVWKYCDMLFIAMPQPIVPITLVLFKWVFKCWLVDVEVCLIIIIISDVNNFQKGGMIKCVDLKPNRQTIKMFLFWIYVDHLRSWVWCVPYFALGFYILYSECVRACNLYDCLIVSFGFQGMIHMMCCTFRGWWLLSVTF